MKRIIQMALVTISIGMAACVGAPDEEVISGEEETLGDASDALTEIVTMGSLGWADQSVWTTDLVLGHRVLNVLNKYASVETHASFPNLTGAWTSQRDADCRAAYMDVYFYKRPNSSGSWTQFDHVKVFATPTISNGQITSCMASFGTPYCDPITFTSDNEFEVDVIAIGGGAQGNKTSVVRYPIINLANCP